MRDRTKQREEMEDVGDRYLAKGMKLKKIDRKKGRYSISRKKNRKKGRKKRKHREEQWPGDVPERNKIEKREIMAGRRTE